MIIILLPNTNIYLPEQIPVVSFTISPSINYYLNHVKEKTATFDYSYFINVYQISAKNSALSLSYYIYREIILHFDLQNGSWSQYVSYFPKSCDNIDWGIIQACHSDAKINIICGSKMSATISPELSKYNICWNKKNRANLTILDEFSIDAIDCQIVGSSLIMKIENCFDENIIKSLYYLCAVYGKVFITKPLASWGGDSVKYVVCNYYKGTVYKNILIEYLKVTNIFLSKMEEINCIYGEIQIDLLMSIFNKGERLNNMMKNYQQHCISWFNKHKLEHKIDMDFYCNNVA